VRSQAREWLPFARGMHIDLSCIDLSSHKLEAFCALSTAGLVAIRRLYKFRSVDGDFFAGVIEALLAGGLWPAAVILLLYPFYDKPPDLARYKIHIMIAGVGLLYVSSIVIRRSLRPEKEKSIS
jgi:hypothetical protein